MRKFTWLLAPAPFLLVLFTPVRTEACSCSFGCQDKLCFGGCSIDLPGECGCVCSGGSCSFKCRGVGSMQCREANEIGDCPRGSSPAEAGSCAQRETALAHGWAVIEYWTDGQTLATENDAFVLDSSTQAFGEFAVREFLKGLNREISLAQAEAAKSGQPQLPAERLRHATLYYAAQGLGTGRRVSVNLKTKVAPPALESGTRAYIRGQTDATGRVRNVEVLYSPNTTGREIAELTKEVFVVRPEESSSPLEFFGYVGVFRDRQIGYVLSAYEMSETAIR